MKKSLRNKWTKALRSGKIQQGMHKLLLPDKSMCCLGVLCLVSGMSPLQIRKIQITRHGRRVLNKLLNKPLLEKFGLTSEQQELLADMNDHETTFEEIADEIEQTVGN